MAIFGYDGVYTATFGLGNKNQMGSVFTITEVGTVTKLTINFKTDEAGVGRGLIYKHSDLSLVGETDETAWGAANDGWLDFPFTTQPELEADTAYVLMFFCGTAAGFGEGLRFIAGDADQGHYEDNDYNDASNPLDPTHNDNKYLIYATYEAAPVGTNMKINISDVFKDIDSIKINIGNVWKDVVKVQQNIGDAWKNVFG